MDDEGTPDGSEGGNDEQASAERQSGLADLATDSSASAGLDEFSTMAPYQASFAAPTEGGMHRNHAPTF